MKIIVKTACFDENCDVVFEAYKNGAPCIWLTSYEGAPLIEATNDVSIFGLAYVPREGYAVIRDHGQYKGLVTNLAVEGVIEEPSEWINGPSNLMFPVCKLTKAARAEQAAQEKANGSA